MSAAALSEARKFYEAGYHSRAEQLCRQILQGEQDSGEVRHLLAQALAEQGKFDEAVHHARHALRLEPAQGALYLHLADTLLRQGRMEDTVTCLRECLTELPSFPEAHCRLGDVLVRLCRLQEAVSHYQEAIRLRAEFAEAHNNLAKAYLILDQIDEAIEHAQEALNWESNFVDAHVTLGTANRKSGRVVEGQRCCQRALELQPDYVPAHTGLGEAFVELGDMQQAKLHLRRGLGSNSHVVSTLFTLALHGLYTAAEPDVDTLKSWLADPHLPIDSAIWLHFALGNLLERAEAWDDAFAHYKQGNQLLLSLHENAGRKFNPAIHAQAVDRLIATYSSEYFRRVHGWGLETQVPVFIVGMPRSGTTLVEQILSNHPKVFGAGELSDLGRLAENLPKWLGVEDNYPECLEHLDAAVVRELAQIYLSRLTRDSGTAERVSDKWPQNFLRLGFIATLFPQARLIWCRRDPIDTCLSCFFHLFRLNFTSDLDFLGRYYRDLERLLAHWKSVLPLPILEVDYEELVAQQEAVSRRIIDFCGLEWDERCLKFHENRRPVRTASTLQVRRPIYTSSVGRWRRYAAHLEPLIAALGSGDPSNSVASGPIAEECPASSQSAKAAAEECFRAGYLSRAEELCRQILQTEPANGDIWFLLGNVLFREGKLAEAVTPYRHAIEHLSDAGGGYLNLANVFQRQGDLKSAAVVLQECIERVPEFPAAHLNLANAYLKLGRLEEAVTQYQEALRQQPDFAEAHKNLGTAFLKLRRTVEATGHLEQAINLRSDYAEAHYSLGCAYRQDNRLSEAIQSLRRALELRPEFSQGHNSLGEAYLEQGDFSQGEYHLRRAFQCNPRAIRPLLTLATHGLYRATEPSIDALRSWVIDPRTPAEPASLLHLTLAKLLERAGLIEEAETHVRLGNALQRGLHDK
jgi:tetratricopeptide (TPR) repeat protein